MTENMSLLFGPREVRLAPRLRRHPFLLSLLVVVLFGDSSGTSRAANPRAELVEASETQVHLPDLSAPALILRPPSTPAGDLPTGTIRDAPLDPAQRSPGREGRLTPETVPTGAAAGSAPAASEPGDGSSPQDWLTPLLEQVRPESSLGLALTFSLIGFIPGILITLTAYARIIIVLGFLRHGLAIPNVPPNSVMAGLALFLTYFTMSPVIDRVNEAAIRPWLSGQIRLVEAVREGTRPLSEFMLDHARPKDLELFLELARSDRPDSASDIPMRVLVPSFILSELKTAFKIGVLILLPFLLVDLVVGVIVSLLSLGPGVASSLGLVTKLSLFTAVDGWHLIAGSLVRSFSV